MCRVYNYYRDKGMSERGLEKLLKEELGGKVFIRGTDIFKRDRHCKKYVEIEEVKNERQP